MSSPDSQANGLDKTHTDGVAPSAPPTPAPTGPGARQFSPERIKELVDALEIPFDPSVIEWRVINTSKDKARGQVIPYADQRAYTDRLNTLFTPGGWTRRYSVHTSPNFERGKDKKIVAKVFVTCDLTIFGIGSHSATGEEWADDENAGTSAEAQAFKRASACFGLGRYLYYFTGAWVDLDERNRPKKTPQLFGWATPEGWRSGLRPTNQASAAEAKAPNSKGNTGKQSSAPQSDDQLVREIGQMQDKLGTHLYRGLLRSAKAWKPSQIREIAERRKMLERMQAGERGLRRLKAAIDKLSDSTVAGILKSLKIPFVDRVADLETLHKLVLRLEAAVSPNA
jgi:hypothetical protein